MELKSVVPQDAHPKPITCIAHHTGRREVISGSEDSIIRAWDTDTGRLTATFEGHSGWITALVYCKEIKCLVSSSQDGTIIVWSNNCKILQKIQTGSPVYSLAWNSRRNQLMCGQKGGVRVYQAKEDFHILQASTGTAGNASHIPDLVFDLKDLHLPAGSRGSGGSTHTDIVSCLHSCEARFYSGGFDQRLVIYESLPHGLRVQVVTSIANAHDAGITCMTYAKDAENAWLITGSFDRCVKLWSLDGNCLQRFDGFLDTITGLAYVPPIQTLWISCNSLFPIFLDPRSGVNISDFVKADNDKVHDKNASVFKHLYFLPDTNEVVAITGRRQLVTWRFNPAAPVTTLECLDAVDALTCTRSDPVLMFSSGINALVQWERMQLNTFMYAREPVSMHAALLQMAPAAGAPGSAGKKMAAKQQQQLVPPAARQSMAGRRALSFPLKSTSSSPAAAHRVPLSHRSAPGTPSLGRSSSASAVASTAKLTATTMLFHDALDLLVVAFEERRVLTWGYQQDDHGDASLLPPEIQAQSGHAGESIANRITGLTLRYRFDDHRDAVTCLAVCEEAGGHFLLTSGWDRRIYVYDLRTGTLVDSFRDPTSAAGREELAADGPVLDLAVRPRSSAAAPPQFAYASADKFVYVRQFHAPGGTSTTATAATTDTRMPLVGVLAGHEAEVTKVAWAGGARAQWVSGSEDKSIRFWDPHTLACLIVVNNESPVTAMCMDLDAGLVVVGARDRVLRVFDGDRLVQRNVGHTDEIRAVHHIAGRRQYVTSSWDCTIRIWNAYHRGKRSRHGGGGGAGAEEGAATTAAAGASTASTGRGHHGNGSAGGRRKSTTASLDSSGNSDENGSGSGGESRFGSRRPSTIRGGSGGGGGGGMATVGSGLRLGSGGSKFRGSAADVSAILGQIEEMGIGSAGV
ncbi:hypothetical protein H9P43_000570 [Blastocladiella emersonii ATCC 22665]|nr:hypothetical protein H9P43_000570 [Blastocladiella emersonii ATCC 22665]